MEQLQFVGIALAIRRIGQRTPLFAVKARVDIDTSGQEQAARFNGKVLVLNGQVAGTSRLEGIVVELGALQGGRPPMRDGDQGFIGHSGQMVANERRAGKPNAGGE